METKGNSGELSRDDLIKENAIMKEELVCKVCRDSQATILLLPCGHVSACHWCLPAITKCPVCKIRFQRYVCIYRV